jgi:signal transduction histidine kinase
MAKKQSFVARRERRVPAREPDGAAVAAAPARAATGPSVSPAEWLEEGLALLDSSRRLTHISDGLAGWLGAPGQQLLGTPFEEALGRRCPEAKALLAPAWASPVPWTHSHFPALHGRKKCWLRLEMASNPAGWFVRLNSTLPPLRDLVETGADGHLADDAEKVQLRLRVLRAESQLDKLLQCWPGVLFSQRADFSFQQLSGKVEELTGVPPEAWRQQPRLFWEVIHEADVDEFKRQCRQAAQVPAGVTSTYRLRHAVTGRVSYVLEHRQAAVSKSGLVLGYEGFWLDITRQTLAEHRLSTAAWKETLALVTLGLAHDFSNQLSGVISLTELIVSQTPPGHASVPTLEMIKHSALQASQLVQRIVNLHRSKTGSRQYLDFNQTVSELAELVCKVLPRRIRVETQMAQEQLPVYMDAVEFRQVVLNLALNAADAMPKHGTLLFRVSSYAAEQTLPHYQGKFPRLPCVCLSVQDDGTGIAARHIPHLFDPFFTTKPLTKGSGLGLYNARVFVEEHGGAISVDSTEGVGSTFHLWLPRADFTEAERMANQDAQRRRSVLLVGQPGLAVDSITEFLRTNNFYVVATQTPARALELLASEERDLHGVMVVADPGDNAMLGLVADLRERGLARRLVLQIIGGNADQLDQRLLEKADLVLPSDAEAATILRKLNLLFTAEPRP